MKIILLKDSAAKKSVVCLSGKKLVIGGIASLIFAPVIIGALSYWVVAAVDRAVNPFVDPKYRQVVESRVNSQQERILETRTFVRQHMDVLGSKIGSLQAQVSRINAIEQRIAEASGIDLADFQFEGDPPLGGTDVSTDVDSEEVDIEDAITAIQNQLDLRESEMAEVDFLLNRNNLQSDQTPSGWPVNNGWVSSSYGNRMHPITGKKQFHRGVDIPGKMGAAVLAVADGVVTRSEKSGHYGWLVEIDHGDDYSTLYGHNKRNTVDVGQTVRKGEMIAEVGNSGRSTGAHVHFEVKKGNRNINPSKYLRRKG